MTRHSQVSLSNHCSPLHHGDIQSVAFVQSRPKKLAMRSKRRLPAVLHPRHASFNLLIRHKHHNVPGPQSQERRHEPEGDRTIQVQESQTGHFSAVCFMFLCVWCFYPLQKAVGPSCLSMVRAQLMALLYWPDPEFMNRVLTTSTGEATTVVQKPAPKAAVKWHGRLSEGQQEMSHILPQQLMFVFGCERNQLLESVFLSSSPVIRSYFRMSSLIMSQVTSSAQFTMALRVMFGIQPRRKERVVFKTRRGIVFTYM